MTLKTNWLGLARTGATALAIAGLSATVATAAEFEFKLHQMLGAKAPAQTKMLEPWARQVEENSGGRVHIEIYPAMSLGGKPPELVQQARDGVVDIVWTVNGYTPGLFPRTEVFELPNVFLNDPVAANLAMYDMFESDLKDDYKGLEVMFLHTHAGMAIFTVDKMVRKPSDMEGLIMRIPSRTGSWVIETLGATPLATPVPNVPQALSKKVIDGTLLPWEIIPPFQLQNQLNHFVEGADSTRLGSVTFQVSMNGARYDGLPPEIQKAFKDASGPEWWAEVGNIWRGGDNYGMGLVTDAGKENTTLTAEETQVFLDALAPVVDRWIDEVTSTGLDGAGLVDKARAAIAAHSEM